MSKHDLRAVLRTGAGVLAQVMLRMRRRLSGSENAITYTGSQTGDTGSDP